MPHQSRPHKSTSVAVTIPGVGAYAAGSPTTAFGYCALGPNNAAQNAGPPPTGLADPTTAVNPTEYYPNAATVAAQTDELAATTDGYHIIGATAGSGGQLTDIGVQIPDGACPLKTALNFPSNPQQFSLATPDVASINQVLVSPNSQLAFVTFEPTSPTAGNNTLPAYKVPCTTYQSSQGNCPAGQPTTGSHRQCCSDRSGGRACGWRLQPGYNGTSTRRPAKTTLST